MRRAKLDFDAARDTLDGEPQGGVVQFIDGKSEVAWSSFPPPRGQRKIRQLPFAQKSPRRI